MRLALRPSEHARRYANTLPKTASKMALGIDDAVYRPERSRIAPGAVECRKADFDPLRNSAAFSMTAVHRKRALSRETPLLPRPQRDGDEGGTAEHHVDPDEQAERPEERPWQAGDDDTREDQIDDTVYQNRLQ